MNNTRSQRRNPQSRERDSYVRYFDTNNGRQNSSYDSGHYDQNRSFRSREEQDRDFQSRYTDYPNDSRYQGRYQFEDSYREPRYEYPQNRPEYSRTYGRNDSNYGNEMYERSYSNGYSDSRSPRFEYIEQGGRDSQERYSRPHDGSRRFRNQDQELDSRRFDSQYEGRSNGRYEDSDYDRDSIRRSEQEEYYSY